MPPSITSEKITLTYPVFCANFISGGRLLVGGGGGEGRSGVGNKITLLGVSEPPTTKKSVTEVSIKILSELELSKQEDAVMSLAVIPSHSSSSSLEVESHHPKRRKKTLPVSELATTTASEKHEPSADKEEETTWLALAGINSSESTQNSGKNYHFRIFNVSAEASSPASISPVSKHEFFSSAIDTGSYQRLIRTNGSVVAIGSGAGLVSKAPSEVVILDAPSWGLKRRIRLPGKEECVDLDLSDDGLLVYCTAKEIFITSTRGRDGDEPPRKLPWQSSPPMKGSLRSVRFCGPGYIIAVLNHPARTGSELLLINTTSNGKFITRKNLHKNVKAVTGMDTISLGPHQSIVSVAGADQSVEILVIENNRIVTVKTFREVHPFQITKVAFSPASTAQESVQLATASMGNTVVIFTLPLLSGSDGRRSLLRGSSVMKQTLISVFLSLIGVVIFAVALQLMFEARAGLSLPIERNAIFSRFNEVLGAKTAETTALEAETTALEAETTALEAETTALEAETTALEAETTALEAETTALEAETTALEAKEPFIVLKEVENGNDNVEVDVTDTIGVTTESLIIDVD